MSHLIPEKRADRHGKMVTRHVKAVTAPINKVTLPAPSTPASAESRPLVFLKKLGMRIGGEDAAAYLEYVNRQPSEYREAIIEAIATTQSDDELDAVRCVVDEATSTLGTLALDDLSFIMELAKQHTMREGVTGPVAYSPAVMIMDQSFREHFDTRNTPVNSDSVQKYAPLLRAASVTRTLRIDDNSLTTFDKVDQIRHIHDNIDTFRKHLPACRSVTLHAGDDMRFTSNDLLNICDLLDAHPGSDDLLINYVSERKRYSEEEFILMLSGASRSLSEGTL